MIAVLLSPVAFSPAPSSQGPCDIYATGGTPCVAAHSMVRALYGSYAGPLYLVQRASDLATAPINAQAAGGYANASAQDIFCAKTDCTVTRIFDQSSRGNHLNRAPWGGASKSARKLELNRPVQMVSKRDDEATALVASSAALTRAWLSHLSL